MQTINAAGINGGQVSLGAADLGRARAGISTLALPGETGYDAGRTVWNGMFDRRPALVARCHDETEIAAAVRFARDYGLAFAVKGGGHSVAGHSAIDDGLLIDLSPMREVRVDPDRRFATVQGGALWSDVDRETQRYGLMTPGGEVSLTGVAGLTLGGGVGLCRRKFGLSCDNVASYRVVTATGEVVVASEYENSDLYWALQGGGGNFGIVSEFTFRLHELGPRIFALSVAYPFESAAAVARGWRDLADSMPDEVSTNFLVWSIPPLPDFPEEMHGMPIVLVEGFYAGDPERGSRVMAPFAQLAEPLWNESGEKDYAEAQAAYDGFFNDGDRYFFKSHFIDELGDGAIDEILSWAARRVNPNTLFVVRHLGGAVAARADHESAFANRGAGYNLSLDAIWSDEADDTRNIDWMRACWDALRPLATGGVYLNFAGTEDGALVDRGLGANMARLAEVKAAWDPQNLFRRNANILPAAAPTAAPTAAAGA